MLKRTCVLICTLAWSPISMAVSYDLRGEYENWKSGLGGTSSGMLGGLGVSHAIDEKVSVSGSFVAGGFDTDSTATTDVKRVDVDVSASYRLRPLFSVFLGYQLIQLGVDVKSDETRSFDDRLHALGIGVSSFYPIVHRWMAYVGASASGVYATSTLKAGGENAGTGFSTSVNGGVLYIVSWRTSLGLGFKTRLTNVDYGGDEAHWAHNAARATVSLSRAW